MRKSWSTTGSAWEERDGQPFLSASPPVVLAAIAALTERIRLLSTVIVLSVLDPVRVAEDPLFGIDERNNGIRWQNSMAC